MLLLIILHCHELLLLSHIIHGCQLIVLKLLWKLVLKLLIVLRHLELGLLLSLINLLLKIQIISFDIFVISRISLSVLLYRLYRIFRVLHNAFKSVLIKLIDFPFKSFCESFRHNKNYIKKRFKLTMPKLIISDLCTNLEFLLFDC